MLKGKKEENKLKEKKVSIKNDQAFLFLKESNKNSRNKRGGTSLTWSRAP